MCVCFYPVKSNRITDRSIVIESGKKYNLLTHGFPFGSRITPTQTKAQRKCPVKASKKEWELFGSTIYQNKNLADSAVPS